MFEESKTKHFNCRSLHVSGKLRLPCVVLHPISSGFIFVWYRFIGDGLVKKRTQWCPAIFDIPKQQISRWYFLDCPLNIVAVKLSQSIFTLNNRIDYCFRRPVLWQQAHLGEVGLIRVLTENGLMLVILLWDQAHVATRAKKVLDLHN